MSLANKHLKRDESPDWKASLVNFAEFLHVSFQNMIHRPVTSGVTYYYSRALVMRTCAW